MTDQHVVLVGRRVHGRIGDRVVLVAIIIINFVPREGALEILAEGGLDARPISIDRSSMVDAVGDGVAGHAFVKLRVSW